MTKKVKKLATEIRALPDVDQLQLVDAILENLDKPDPAVDRIWAQEARKRWAANKAEKTPTASYETVMGKYRLKSSSRRSKLDMSA